MCVSSAWLFRTCRNPRCVQRSIRRTASWSPFYQNSLPGPGNSLASSGRGSFKTSRASNFNKEGAPKSQQSQIWSTKISVKTTFQGRRCHIDSVISWYREVNKTRTLFFFSFCRCSCIFWLFEPFYRNTHAQIGTKGEREKIQIYQQSKKKSHHHRFFFFVCKKICIHSWYI